MIITYFGKLPEHIDLWIDSVRHNPDFHWILITDDKLSSVPPDNLHVKYVDSFQSLITMINNRLGYQALIHRPYKLCDLKPAYAYIFEDLIHGFFPEGIDFWGYGDMDVIYGCLGKFITDEILDKTDVFQYFGSFSLIRYNEHLVKLHMKTVDGVDIFRKAITIREHVTFDETMWIYMLVNEGNIRIFAHTPCIMNFSQKSFNLYITLKRNYINQDFFYKKGTLYRIYTENGKEQRDDFLYAHFFGIRKMHILETDPDDCYRITPIGFISGKTHIGERMDVFSREKLRYETMISAIIKKKTLIMYIKLLFSKSIPYILFRIKYRKIHRAGRALFECLKTHKGGIEQYIFDEVIP